MPGRSIRSSALALACAGLLAGGASAKDMGLARHYLEEGLDQYRRGNLEPSLAALNRAAQEAPSSGAVYAGRALARHALGDAAGMREDLARAERLRPRNALEWTARGNARILEGDANGALEDFRRALDLDARSADAFLGRGRAWRAAGNAEKAASALDEALRLAPDSAMAYFVRGRAYFESGDAARATQDMVLALKANPKFPLPYALLGTLFAQRGDLRRAELAYSRALFFNPRYSYAHIGRAAARLRGGKREDALRDYEEAVRSAPGEFAPYYNRGEALWRLGEKEAALADFRRILELPVGERDVPQALAVGDRFMRQDLTEEALRMLTKGLEPVRAARASWGRRWAEEALLKRAQVYAAASRRSEALRDLTEALGINPASVKGWTALGSLRLALGEEEEARKALDHAVSLDPSSAAARLARGRLLAAAGRHQAALEDLNAAIESDSRTAEAYEARGLVYLHGFNDAEKAAADLGFAVSLDPQNGELLFRLGVAQSRRGELRQALDAFDKALKLKADPAQVLPRRAEALAGLGDLAGALADVRSAMEKRPADGNLYLTLAAVRLEAHDPAQALKDLNQAQDLRADPFELRLRLGASFGRLREHRKAIREFKAAVKLGPASVQALAGLCRALRLDGRASQAVRECTRALELDPDFGPGYLDRGLAYFSARDYERAVTDLYEGYRLGARRAGAELARSVAHAALRQWRESDEAYRSAMELDPSAREPDLGFGPRPPGGPEYHAILKDLGKPRGPAEINPHALLVQGDAFHNAGYYDRAVVEYTKAMELDGRLAAVYSDRCAALAAQESPDAAEQDCRKAVELAAKDLRVRIQLLDLLAARRRYPAALPLAAQTVRDFPKAPEAFVKAGHLRYFLKDVARAQENFMLAVALEPRRADALNGLGLCQFARRRYREAIESFSRAVTIQPDNDRYYRNRAAAYVNLGDYSNAAANYRSALAVNTDPNLTSEYEELIKNALYRLEPPEGAPTGDSGG